MPAIEPQYFFRKRRSFQEIKQEIFGKYFDTWCNMHQGKGNSEYSFKLLFIDLEAGCEQELSISSEQKEIDRNYLFRSILKRPEVNEKIHPFIFNKNNDLLSLASTDLENSAYLEDLTHAPIPLINSESKSFMNEVTEAGCKALVFLDPFHSSYAKQLLLQSVDNGYSDLFMLLRPESIIKALAIKKPVQPLIDLFGEHLHKISNYCRKEKDKEKREQFIVSQFRVMLQEKGNFTLHFKVNLPDTEQPYHHLVFSSPDSCAYRKFKDTILPYTVLQEDGVPVFTANEYLQSQLNLFEHRPQFTIPKLTDRILEQALTYKFKSIEKIYELDSCHTNYTRDNYTAAIEQLHKAGKIELLNARTMQTTRQPDPTSIVKFRS